MPQAVLSWNGREQMLLLECVSSVGSLDWDEIARRIGPVVVSDGTVTAQSCKQTFSEICGASPNAFDASAVAEATTVVRKEWLQELSEDIGAKERRVKALNNEVAKLKTAAEAAAKSQTSQAGNTEAEEPKRAKFVPGPGGGSLFVPGPGGGSVQNTLAQPSRAVFVPGPGGGTLAKVVKSEGDDEDGKGSEPRTSPLPKMNGMEPVTPKTEEESDRQRRARIAPLMKVLKLIHQNKHALYFRNPVTAEEVDMEEYMSVIKEPMDLTTLRTRLEEGSIDSAEELWEGLITIVENAMKFNESDSDVYDKAQKLRDFMRKEMESVLEVEKMIASSPHNTATRNRGPRASAIPTPASGRKAKKEEAEEKEPRSTKKRGRKDSLDAEDDEDEPDDKRARRGKAAKEEEAPRAKAARGGRGGRRKA